MLMINADPVQVPVAGRPVDFSGAVGGPFQVRYRIDDVSWTVGNATTFYIEIVGTGDLSQLKPFDLPKLLSGLTFDDSRPVIVVGRADWIWRYTVRPNKAGQVTLPRLKFVYYNPKLRSWQTTNTEPVVIEVADSRVMIPEPLKQWAQDRRDNARVPPTSVLEQVFDWFRRRSGFEISLKPPNWFVWSYWALPPVAGFVVICMWQTSRLHRPPSHIRVAIAVLERANGDEAKHVRDTLLTFLKSESNWHSNCLESFDKVLTRCDRLRFGPRTDVRIDVVEMAKSAVIGRVSMI